MKFLYYMKRDPFLLSFQVVRKKPAPIMKQCLDLKFECLLSNPLLACLVIAKNIMFLAVFLIRKWR